MSRTVRAPSQASLTTPSTAPPTAAWTLAQEARALLTRLARVRPFALQETMVPAAAPTNDAQAAMEQHLSRLRRKLRRRIEQFLRWIETGPGAKVSPAEAQRQFTLLRLEFNRVLSHVDIFSEALSQRSEADTGVLLSGLDVVARDALALPGYYPSPPVICYLARGAGAAIRRARSRLPGGGDNPVAIIRMPRERMIGTGIASSLVHEVGHQAAALLDLLPSLRRDLASVRHAHGEDARAWQLWSGWISEIVADLWAVAKVGITSTVGLIAVVSLPRAFVFRINADDPHPAPWLRVKLSAAIGQVLYPDPQWERLSALWDSYYPLDGLNPGPRALIASMLRTMPAFVRRLLEHRAPRLLLRPLGQALACPARRPERLRALFQRWRRAPGLLRSAPPSLVFAVVGQARSDGAITPRAESDVLETALRHWALQTSIETAAAYGLPRGTRLGARTQAISYRALTTS